MRIVTAAIQLISELLPSIKEAWPESEHLLYSFTKATADYSPIDTIFTLAITILLILLIILYHQRIINAAAGLAATPFNQRYLLNFRRDIVSRTNLNIFLLFGIILFSYVFARYTYHNNITLLGLQNAGITLRFCIIAPIIPLYLIIKRLSFQLLAWVNRERSFNFLFGINIVCIAFSIFLILCYILIAGIIVPHTSPEVAKTCIIFSFALGLILFIVRGYKLIISRGFSHSFWFLYLCTLEFLPFVLAIEVLTI